MKYLHVVFIILLTVVLPASVTAQIEIGSALKSRYVWRGLDFGDSPSVQPSLSFTEGGFSIGTWGAYSITGNGNEVFSEHDVWIGYSIGSPAGTFSLLATDYYYPSARMRYFDYKGDGQGAHTIELGILYDGPDTFPVHIFSAGNIHNDPDNSVYIEIGYSFSFDGAELALFAGGALGKSAWYGTSSTAFINIGLGVTRSVVITDTLIIPLSASFILNPDLQQSYLVFGIEF
jgi:hypothetical protein